MLAIITKMTLTQVSATLCFIDHIMSTALLFCLDIMMMRENIHEYIEEICVNCFSSFILFSQLSIILLINHYFHDDNHYDVDDDDQVSTWFANARRRLKKENKMTWEPRNKANDGQDMEDKESFNGSDDDNLSSSGGIGESHRSSSPSSLPTGHHSMSRLSPVHGVKNEPHEQCADKRQQVSGGHQHIVSTKGMCVSHEDLETDGATHD